DRIRAGHVTGVQTCALPISGAPFLEITGTPSVAVGFKLDIPKKSGGAHSFEARGRITKELTGVAFNIAATSEGTFTDAFGIEGRSEERRVGEGWRARWWAYR